MLTYRTVLTIACVVLGLRYAFDADASIRGRVIVAAVAITSFFMSTSPAGQVVGIVEQLGVALFVLFRLKALRG